MRAAVVLVGAGRVGLSLMRHLRRKRIPLYGIVERDPDRRMQASGAFPGAILAPDLPAPWPSGITHCILAIPDGEISNVARALASEPSLPAGLVVFHTSGSATSEALTPLATRDCMTGSMHPMQSFPDQALPDGSLDGIGCGIEGSDAFYEQASALATALDWRPLRIATERKALYHAANVFVGNFPVALAQAAEMLLRASASNAEEATLQHLHPMLETVVDRIGTLPPAEALTGPAARGDVETIARHLAALKAFDPELRAVYVALTEWIMTDG